MRRDLTAISKRVEKMRQRARLLVVPPLAITCTGEWDEADRRAYAVADEAERSALEDRYLGDLPPHPDPLGIRGIVVVSASAPPTDDEDDDLPSGWTAAEYEAAKRYREQIVAESLLAAPTETDDAAETDPRDLDPLGDPHEVIYEHPQFGPVTRAEHQLRRRLAREQADRIAEQRARAVSSYTSYNRLESR